MDSAALHAREVRSLTALVRELAGFGFCVTMSDATPAVFVRSAEGRLILLVLVDGDAFRWRHGEDSHPVADPSGAAAEMAAAVWKRAGDAWAAQRPGESS